VCEAQTTNTASRTPISLRRPPSPRVRVWGGAVEHMVEQTPSTCPPPLGPLERSSLHQRAPSPPELEAGARSVDTPRPQERGTKQEKGVCSTGAGGCPSTEAPQTQTRNLQDTEAILRKSASREDDAAVRLGSMRTHAPASRRLFRGIRGAHAASRSSPTRRRRLRTHGGLLL
jgi:hypothetical protein